MEPIQIGVDRIQEMGTDFLRILPQLAIVFFLLF